jgi:hypothetical protein
MTRSSNPPIGKVTIAVCQKRRSGTPSLPRAQPLMAESLFQA